MRLFAYATRANTARTLDHAFVPCFMPHADPSYPHDLETAGFGSILSFGAWEYTKTPRRTVNLDRNWFNIPYAHFVPCNPFSVDFASRSTSGFADPAFQPGGSLTRVQVLFFRRDWTSESIPCSHCLRPGASIAFLYVCICVMLTAARQAQASPAVGSSSLISYSAVVAGLLTAGLGVASSHVAPPFPFVGCSERRGDEVFGR